MAKQIAQTGAIQEAKQQQLANANKQIPTLKDFVELRMPEIQKVLPSVITPTQFLRHVLNAIQNTPHLQECTIESFYGAVMQCAQYGLKPNVNGEAYLLPFKNYKKGGIYECQFIPGYKGLMILTRRSGEVKNIVVQTVYENDTFDLSYGYEPELIHKPLLKGDRGNVMGYYAAIVLKDGGRSSCYMTRDEAYEYGKHYSKAFDNSPWQTDFDAMAKKSCLRQVLKYAPMSTDVDTIIREEDKFADTQNEKLNLLTPNEIISPLEAPLTESDITDNTATESVDGEQVSMLSSIEQ